MSTIQITNQEIYYAARSNESIRYGNESIRYYAPLVFIHGAGGSHLEWNGQLAYWAHPFVSTQTSSVPADTAPQGVQTIALDLPGHGRSRGAGRKTILEYANIVREFLDALKIERAIIVGVSMGGAIAQTLALEFPERVAGLVLVGTGAKLRVAPEFLDGLKNDFENTARVLVENFYAPDTSPPTPLLQREGGRRELLVEKSLEQLRQTGSIVTYNDFAACDAFDIRERISAIAAPTLIVCGRDDKMTPLKYSEFLAQKIPHARLVVIENAGHMVMVEQDTAFGDALRKWLAAPA